MDAPQAYPLQWPAGRPRSGTRTRGRFARVESGTRSLSDGSAYTYSRTKPVTLTVATQRLQKQLDLLGAERAVLSTNVPLRLDGGPRGSAKEPDDPGAAVYFWLDGDPVTLACDKYESVADNVAALAAHINASRAIERYGVGTLREIFRGFAALPPAMAVDDWRKVLGHPRTREEAEAVYRERMKKAHPDVGGDAREAAALNAAIERAREALA